MVMAMGAGQKRVARGEAVHIAVLDEEIERAVDGDGGRAAAVFAEEFHHVIGTERLPRGFEHIERAPAAGGELGWMLIVVGQVCLA
jgi:hypothetical protein